jgi:hypothetical protein
MCAEWIRNSKSSQMFYSEIGLVLPVLDCNTSDKNLLNYVVFDTVPISWPNDIAFMSSRIFQPTRSRATCHKSFECRKQVNALLFCFITMSYIPSVFGSIGCIYKTNCACTHVGTTIHFYFWVLYLLIIKFSSIQVHSFTCLIFLTENRNYSLVKRQPHHALYTFANWKYSVMINWQL